MQIEIVPVEYKLEVESTWRLPKRKQVMPSPRAVSPPDNIEQIFAEFLEMENETNGVET
ncbi:MAG: hypothetical protein RLZZ574_1575 [Cyanobacteriota bacterium]|jgi:hypothetical protein